MGTRADFYVGRGIGAEWIGSIGWDGYPEGIDATVFGKTTEADYRAAVSVFLVREDATKPTDGWPWPWDDSRTTDYSYAFDGDKVWASSFGCEWFDPLKPQPEDDDGKKVAVFPDMKRVKNLTLGPRSGVIVF